MIVCANEFTVANVFLILTNNHMLELNNSIQNNIEPYNILAYSNFVLSFSSENNYLKCKVIKNRYHVKIDDFIIEDSISKKLKKLNL